MKNRDEQLTASYRWELPLASAEVNSTGYIHGNAKVHLFSSETGFSHCKRYWQIPNYTKEIVYDGEERNFCKKCLKKYKRERGRENGL